MAINWLTVLSVVCTLVFVALFVAVFWLGWWQLWLFVPVGVMAIIWICRDSIERWGRR